MQMVLEKIILADSGHYFARNKIFCKVLLVKEKLRAFAALREIAFFRYIQA
jgi:hypothetical protein